MWPTHEERTHKNASNRRLGVSKYADCECKTGKYPNVPGKDKGKDDKCFEPKELPAELTVAYYDANADKDGDGFPDKSEKPVICLSYEAKFRRVELLPQCKPTTKPPTPK